MTNERVEQLDGKSSLRYFIVVNNQSPRSDVMKHMQWEPASHGTNLIHLQGLAMLDADQEGWAEVLHHGLLS